MPIRPVDSEQLVDICRDIALENYGFLYVDRVKDRIRSQYEGAETSLLHAGSIAASDVKKVLQEAAGDDFSGIRQIRTGVYYCDPFGLGDGEHITTQLTSLFDRWLVVTGEVLRSRFDLAIDDVDFFAAELESRDLIRRITAGDQDYYTVGPRLKEHAGEAGVDAQLRRRTSHGKITHDDLEDAIDVAATTDVIRYLEREGFIVDLDGEYLVKSDLEDYCAYLADEIHDAVAEEFEEATHVMPVEEFERVVRNAISDRFEVLSRMSRKEGDTLLEGVIEQLQDESRLGLDETDGMVRESDAYEEFVEASATRIVEDALREEIPPTVSTGMERMEDDVAEISTGGRAAVDDHVRASIRERCETLLEAEFSTESEDTQ